MDKLYLHAVIVKKDKHSLEDAKRLSQDIIKDSRKSFYRETEDSYRFRNIPKTAFIPGTFKTKIINEGLSLVFGHLREAWLK